VSKAIADMEHAIGVRLLDRTSKGVECTAYGRALLRRGMGAFDELRQGIKDIESLSDPTIGEVRVGCPEAIAAGLLSAVIDRFSRAHPRAVVSVTAADNMSPAFQPLRDRNVDFLVGRIPQPFIEHDLDAEVLYQDRIYIVSGRNSRWARRRKIELAELVDEPWLLSPSIFVPLVTEAFQAVGSTVPKATVKSYSIHQSINLLATGRFIAVLAGSVLRFSADRSSLATLPVDFVTHPYTIGAVTLKNRTIGPVVQTFMNCIREVSKPMAKRRFTPS
jgi:DNA-binding transcriptional LysR family regulator